MYSSALAQSSEGACERISLSWRMAKLPSDFALFCCELLSSQGPCVPKRMFGGYSISIDGLTLAVIADVGEGEKLYLKGDADTRARYEAAGCKIFLYPVKGVLKSMHYYTAPEDAMDSPDAMLPWARLAMECALRARAVKPIKPVKKAASPTKAINAKKESKSQNAGVNIKKFATKSRAK
jgi:DNA transformation protein and related proteins